MRVKLQKQLVWVQIQRFASYTAFGDVVGVVHDVSGQAEVTNLHQLALTDQNIPGSQIPMDALWRERQPNPITRVRKPTRVMCKTLIFFWMFKRLLWKKTLKGFSEQVYVLISYILGGQELHSLRHLEAETQEVVVGETGRVTHYQVHLDSTCTRWQTGEEREGLKTIKQLKADFLLINADDFSIYEHQTEGSGHLTSCY